MIAYVDMVGDLFHIGHVELFKKALHTTYDKDTDKFGKLIVGVHSDEDVASYKRRPIMTMVERIGIIGSCRYVDRIVPNAPMNPTVEFLDEISADYVVHGREDDEVFNEIYSNVIAAGRIKWVPYYEGISTSDILNRIRSRSDI